jgi:hypothetical protein
MRQTLQVRSPDDRHPSRILSAKTSWALGPLLLLILTAAAPEGADPDSSVSEWYRGLRQPDTNMGCCSIADCRPVQYRIVGNRYEFLLDGRFSGVQEPKWVPVPAPMILDHTPNPTGSAVACWEPHSGVRCFVRPSDS